jgi:hypothetical protein
MSDSFFPVQNKINERVGKASKCYHLAKSLLWNKDVDRQCKVTIFNMYFKKLLLYGAETWTYTEREESKLKQLR